MPLLDKIFGKDTKKEDSEYDSSYHKGGTYPSNCCERDYENFFPNQGPADAYADAYLYGDRGRFEASKDEKAFFQPDSMFDRTLGGYKKLVKAKLTIVLLEKTADVEMLTKMLPKMLKEGNVCFVVYGSRVEISEMLPVKEDMDITKFFEADVSGDNTCLYDALILIPNIISRYRFKVIESKSERIMVDSFEVMGVGRCIEKGSTNSKEYALKMFADMIKYDGIVTKYYCLTDKEVINAASVGFRSVGALSTIY